VLSEREAVVVEMKAVNGIVTVRRP